MSLMERCCEKCTHAPETPCRNYVACRSSGPLCHDDEACRARIAKAREKTINGSCGLIVKIGMSTCGLAAGAQETYVAIQREFVYRGVPAEVV